MDANLMRYLTADMQAGIDDQRAWSGEICPECGSPNVRRKIGFGVNDKTAVMWVYQCWDCETQFYVTEADRRA